MCVRFCCFVCAHRRNVAAACANKCACIACFYARAHEQMPVDQCCRFACPRKLLARHPSKKNTLIFVPIATPHTSGKAVYCIFTLARHQLGWPWRRRAQRERECRWKERIRPGGPRCAPCVRGKREREKEKKRPPSPRMSLFVPKRLVRQPELQRFCVTGSTRSTRLRSANTDPSRPLSSGRHYGERLAGQFDASERLSCCQPC